TTLFRSNQFGAALWRQCHRPQRQQRVDVQSGRIRRVNIHAVNPAKAIEMYQIDLRKYPLGGVDAAVVLPEERRLINAFLDCLAGLVEAAHFQPEARGMIDAAFDTDVDSVRWIELLCQDMLPVATSVFEQSLARCRLMRIAVTIGVVSAVPQTGERVLKPLDVLPDL